MDERRTAWRRETARPVAWSAWYPAAAGASATHDIFGSGEAALFRATPVALKAALSTVEATWPVVVMSHGTGGSAQSLSWLGHALANKGLVAIGVSHHGNTSLEPALPEGFLCWWERTIDLSFIMDHLAATGRFAGLLDFSQTAAVGFSLGAYCVLSLAGATTHMPLFDEWLASAGRLANAPREFPDLGRELARLLAESQQFRQSWARSGDGYRDDRIKAAVLLAPAPPVRALTPASLAAIHTRLHIIASGGDMEAPIEGCASWLCRQNAAFSMTQLPDAVGHYVFLPEATPFGKQVAPEICADISGVDRSSVHADVVALCARAFAQGIG